MKTVRVYRDAGPGHTLIIRDVQSVQFDAPLHELRGGVGIIVNCDHAKKIEGVNGLGNPITFSARTTIIPGNGDLVIISDDELPSPRWVPQGDDR